MAWRFVQQPDRKFAIFSEIVDDFTKRDMTFFEAICWGCENTSLSISEINEKILRAIGNPQRWSEAKQIIERKKHGTHDAF